MRRRRAVLALAAFAVAMVAGAGDGVAGGDDDVELVVIVASANTQAVSASDLEAWFLRKERRWPNGDVLVPINAPPDTPPRRVFDRAALKMSPEESARYWLDQRIRSGDSAPREVVKLVAKLPGAIAYVAATQELAGVRVVARVRRGAVVAP
jgi:hypothetical protein